MRRMLPAGLAVLALSTALAPAASAEVNRDTVALFTAWVNYEADRYGTGPVQVVVQHLDEPLAVAGTDRNGVISLNTDWAVLSPEQFHAELADDMAAGYQPGGCSGIQAAAIHEMGHVIDRRRGQIARMTVTRSDALGQVGHDLHGYAFDENGNLEPGEAVAVSFQAVECGSATPTEQRIYNLLVNQ
jgi:hypothetical protein